MRNSVVVAIVLSMLMVPIHLVGKTSILFGPDDEPISQLIELIDGAKKRVYVAIYMISDKKVTDALIKAHKRKVDVQVIIDPFSLGKLGKGIHLIQNEVPTFIYKPIINGLFEDHLHTKFALIDNLFWNGSANFSLAGNSKNQECVMCTTDKDIRTEVEGHFEELKKRSISYAEHQEGHGNRPFEQKENSDINPDNAAITHEEFLAEAIEAQQL